MSALSDFCILLMLTVDTEDSQQWWASLHRGNVSSVICIWFAFATSDNEQNPIAARHVERLLKSKRGARPKHFSICSVSETTLFRSLMHGKNDRTVIDHSASGPLLRTHNRLQRNVDVDIILSKAGMYMQTWHRSSCLTHYCLSPVSVGPSGLQNWAHDNTRLGLEACFDTASQRKEKAASR